MLGHAVALVQVVHVSRKGERHTARDELGIEGGREGGGLYVKSLGCPLEEAG